MNLTKKQLSAIVVFTVLVTALFMAPAVYVLAQSGGAFTIESGVYPGASSFTVWEEDGSFFAKNQYGVIGYSGTDAATVIQAALNTMNYGDTLRILGDITINEQISLIRGITVDFDTLRLGTTDIKCFFYEGLGLPDNININGKRIIFPVGYSSSVIQLLEARFCDVDIGEIMVSGPGYAAENSRGIDLQSANSEYGCYYNNFKVGLITALHHAIFMMAFADSDVGHNHFYDTQISACNNGVTTSVDGSGVVAASSFNGVSIWSPHLFSGTMYGFYFASGSSNVDNICVGCTVGDTHADQIGLRFGTNSELKWFGGALASPMTTPIVILSGASCKIFGLRQPILETWGSTSTANGNSLLVTHNLGMSSIKYTPNFINIAITGGPTEAWSLSDIGDTTFKVNFETTTSHAIQWHAKYNFNPYT